MLPAPVEKRAFTIGGLVARGGLGVSTVAINLGGTIHSTTDAEVIVAELRPGMGTIGMELGLMEPVALTRLLEAQQSEITKQTVMDALFHHDSGVHVLPASISPRDSSLVNNVAQMELIVNRLAHMAEYLVLDLGPGLLTQVKDYSFTQSEPLAEVNYAQLRAGTIPINGKDIPTVPWSSYVRAKEIAELLNSWILAGEFLLGEPQHPIPKSTEHPEANQAS